MFNQIKKLKEEEYQNTFTPPMRLIENSEEISGVNVKKYVRNILKREKLDTDIKEIDIHYIYHSPDEKYEHILFNYGIKELYMVLVIGLVTKKILGYHMLDLIKKYERGEDD